MIDFYLNRDGLQDIPVEADFIGKITLEEFQISSHLWRTHSMLNEKMSFFKDFELSFEESKELYLFIKDSESSLKLIVKEAISMKVGLIAYCD